MLTRRSILASMTGLGGTLAARPGQALERGTLFEVASRLVPIYQASDADALHAILAPDLQTDFPPTALARWLSEAQATFGVLQRTSLPTYGSRAHSIFVAYFDRGPSDMFLEIDQQEKVLLWALKNDSRTLAIRRRT